MLPSYQLYGLATLNMVLVLILLRQLMRRYFVAAQGDEIAACEPLLKRQIEIVGPRVICTLGRFAAQTLLRTTTSMGRLRGQVYDYEGVKLVPTYHPAALLRNPQWKRPTWEDLKRLRLEYDGVKL